MKWVGDSCEVTAVTATLESETLSSETLLLLEAKYSLICKVVFTIKEFSKEENIKCDRTGKQLKMNVRSLQ